MSRKRKDRATEKTPPTIHEKPDMAASRATLLMAGMALVIITLIVYWGIWSASFADIDDNAAVRDNAQVREGITPKNIKLAFSTNLLGNYIPLTMLSHMLDSEIYGMNAGGHHLTSLLIHIVNALLLFIVLFKMTGALWRSWAVAALFAIHPLHVESVAWISERKDVLCALFWFLGLLAYSCFVQKRTAPRYFLVVLAFILGLLSKAMIITFPFVLLLLDFWPLERWNPLRADSTGEAGCSRFSGLGNLLLEKLPLFLLIPVFSAITWWTQRIAIVPMESVPLKHRVANAAISYAEYLKDMFFPAGLAVYYPYPMTGISMGIAAMCLMILFAITAAVIYFGSGRKYAVSGWFWYLGTLVPVIGLVQIGAQSRADRYTYVPLVGVFVIVVWIAGEISGVSAALRKTIAASSAVVLVLLMVLAARQAGYWRDSVALFEHTLSTTEDNWFILNNLGTVLYQQGKTEEAKPYFVKAVRINPRDLNSQLNLGAALVKEGSYAEAIEHYKKALVFKPGSAKLLDNLAQALVHEKKLDEAIQYFRKSVEADPGNWDSHNNLGYALLLSGKLDEAIGQYREAIRIKPDSTKSLINLGMALVQKGMLSEAEMNFREAAKIDPKNHFAFLNLGIVLEQQGRLQESADYLRQALTLNPDSQIARDALFNVESTLGGR